ncbi:MAG TPA: hypothetical protein VN345_09495 [Blastocatellia bacterium]|nr:hypothetical protein [Blastocatellia bacterium]
MTMESRSTPFSKPKRCFAWGFDLIALAGVYVSYSGVYIMAAYFAAGLVWWASLALFISGPVGLAAAVLAWVRPRQRVATAIGLAAFIAWLFLWILMLTVGGFSFN